MPETRVSEERRNGQTLRERLAIVVTQIEHAKHHNAPIPDGVMAELREILAHLK